MNGCRGAAIALCFAIFALWPAPPGDTESKRQSSPAAENTLRIHANLVYVPVTVTNAANDPVTNLRRQDFLLMEDGQRQKIRLFEQHASRPLSVVLAIDTSVSVEKNLSLEKHAAHGFIRSLLRQHDRLALTGFSGQVREYVPFTQSAARIERGLNGLRGNGPTALYAAVVQAAQMLEGEPGRRAIVVISDGANSMPGADYSQARLAAWRADASIESVILLPIVASAGRNLGGEHALIQLSQDTGGQYLYVSEPGDLPRTLARLSQSLHSEYLLGYYAPPEDPGDPDRAGDYRHILVQLDAAVPDRSLHLYFRTGYFLGSEQ